jgi:hypothetical protein
MGQECTTCLRGTAAGAKNMQDMDLSKKVVEPFKQVISKLKNEKSLSQDLNEKTEHIEITKTQGMTVLQKSFDSSDSEEAISVQIKHKRFNGKLLTKVSPAAVETAKSLGLKFEKNDEIFQMPDDSLFIGNFDENGAKSGEGLEIANDGSVFKGNFFRDLKEGQGILILENGDCYQGGFKKGVMEGKGKYSSKEGAVFMGQFKNDLKHGFGKEELPDGSTYEGFFEDGVKSGHGKFVWKDGSVYEGEFSEDKIHGKGIYVWANGKRYDGEWKNNQMHGFGVFLWNSGRKYEGQYKFDQKEGLGKLTYPDGRVYDGAWVKGQQHGEAYYTFLNKKTKKYITRKGRWEDGARVEWLKD